MFLSSSIKLDLTSRSQFALKYPKRSLVHWVAGIISKSFAMNVNGSIGKTSVFKWIISGKTHHEILDMTDSILSEPIVMVDDTRGAPLKPHQIKDRKGTI